MHKAFSSLVVLVLMFSCKTTSVNRRGATGLPGQQGEKGEKGDKGDAGIAGVAGKSCQGVETAAGIEVTCEGQKSILIPFAKEGEKGDKGEPGASCTIVDTNAEGITLRCPDAEKPGEFKDVNISNGKNGSSCQVEYTTISSTMINCAGQRFTIYSGQKGDRGDQGPKGDKGDAGEDNYTSTLSSARMSEMTPGKTHFICLADYLTNDKRFLQRAFLTEIFMDGKKLAAQIDEPEKVSDKGTITVRIPNRRSYEIGGKRISCTIGLYAESTYYFRAKALTSKSSSSEIDVVDDGTVLPSAQDFTFENPTLAAPYLLNFKVSSNEQRTKSEGSCLGIIESSLNFLTKDGAPRVIEHFTSFTFQPQDLSKGIDHKAPNYVDYTLLTSGKFAFSFSCSGDITVPGKYARELTLTVP